jgi:hypothetical protein
MTSCESDIVIGTPTFLVELVGKEDHIIAHKNPKLLGSVNLAIKSHEVNN